MRHVGTRSIVGVAAACLGMSALWSTNPGAAEPSAGKTMVARPASAQALEANVNYCREWLQGGDYATLAQTAAGLDMLCEVVLHHASTDDQRRAAGDFKTLSVRLEQAAKAKQNDVCLDLIKQLRAQLKVVGDAFSATPMRAAVDRPWPKVRMKPLMLLLEGTLADAKTSVAVGDLDEARNHARVLLELAPLVSNTRADSKWRGWTDDYAQASRHAAESDTEDAAELRKLLSAVHQRCEACHDRR